MVKTMQSKGQLSQCIEKVTGRRGSIEEKNKFNGEKSRIDKVRSAEITYKDSREEAWEW